MNQEQTYDICSYFDIRNFCPHREDELMKDLISDVAVSSGSTGRILDISKAEEVNKTFCNTCNSFKDYRI